MESLKKRLSKGSFLSLFFIVTILSSFIACTKEDMFNAETFYKDAFAYEGVKPGITNVRLTDNGQGYYVLACDGLVAVCFEKGIGVEKAVQIIHDLDGEIMEQIPYIRYYLVKVESGKEDDFIKGIFSQKAIYAFPIIQLSECHYASIIDDYTTAINHGRNVERVVSLSCGSPSKIEKLNVGSINEDRAYIIDTWEIIDRILSLFVGESLDGTVFYDSRELRLINISLGPQTPAGKWDEWTKEQQSSYIKSWQAYIKEIVFYFNLMSSINKDVKKNNVITMAAGNSQLPDFYKQIIEPMIIIDSENKNRLTKEEQEILKNNLLIVSAIDKRFAPYTNKTSKGNPMAEVDISDLPNDILGGTSFAAPRALSYISQVMEIKKGLTPVEALTAVKEQVKVNINGEFTLDGALASAREMYLSFNWSKKKFPCDIPFKILTPVLSGNRVFPWRIETITCTGQAKDRSGYLFVVKGKGVENIKNYSTGSRTITFVPEEKKSNSINMNQAAAYVFPAVDKCESFELEFKGLFPGYFNDELFEGFLIFIDQ